MRRTEQPCKLADIRDRLAETLTFIDELTGRPPH